MPFLLSESAFASQTGPVVEPLQLAESVLAQQSVIVGDSAGLSEVSSVIPGNAIVAADLFLVPEPAELDFGLRETEVPMLVEATSVSPGALATELITLSEAQTAKTSAAQVITSSEQLLVSDLPLANLGNIAAEQLAVAEAIQALLASVAADSETLTEVGGPSFGVPGFQGLAAGMADLEPDLLAAAGIGADLLGTANLL